MDADALQELAGTYVKDTSREQRLALAFMASDTRCFLRRKKSWDDWFDGEADLVWRAMSECKGPLPSKTEVRAFLEREARTPEEMREAASLYKRLLDFADSGKLDGETFEGVIDVLRTEGRRRLLLSTFFNGLAEVDGAHPDELLQATRSALVMVDDEDVVMSEFFDVERARERIGRYREAARARRFPVGIKQLDSDLGGGFGYGEFIVLIGQSGSGKSFWLAQAAHMATTMGGNVAMFQGEMTLDQSDMRMDTRIAGLDYAEMRRGNVSEDDEERIIARIGRQEREGGGRLFTFYMSDRDFTARGVKDRLEYLRAEGYEVDVVVVDYLLLMHAEDVPRNAPQQERLTACARALNDISNDYSRSDGTIGLVVHTVSQAKADARMKLGSVDEASSLSMEAITAFAQGINHFGNYVYALVEADDVDEALGRKIMVCLKNRFDASGQAYCLNSHLDRATFHENLGIVSRRRLAREAEQDGG